MSEDTIIPFPTEFEPPVMWQCALCDSVNFHIFEPGMVVCSMCGHHMHDAHVMELPVEDEDEEG